MAKPDDETPEAPPAQKGGMARMLLMGLGLFAILTGSNVVSSFIVAPRTGTAVTAPDDGVIEGEDGEPLEEVALPPPIYYPMNPPLIVNYGRNNANFLQLTMEVMARDQAVIEAVKTHDAAIRNNLLMLLAGQESSTLATREGKEALREMVLGEIQNVLAPYLEDDNVEQVYFTSFVSQ